ncbi:hypothetical protein APHAL10511_006607 [Amanita phalloides]|nr:hypothetical protein APHAL10511_006607 [Amanita phalloides]
MATTNPFFGHSAVASSLPRSPSPSSPSSSARSTPSWHSPTPPSSFHSSVLRPVSPDLDASTQLLLAQLTLSDLTAHLASSLPSHPEGSDDLLALGEQESELRAWIAYLQDSVLARSINRAIEADGALVRALVVEEVGEREDRLAAEMLQREGRMPAVSEVSERMAERAPVSARPLGMTVSLGSRRAAPSAPAAVSVPSMGVGGSGGSGVRLECIICTDEFARNKCVTAPCAHVYCHECLVALVEACTRDETLYPIKCCRQSFPHTTLVGLLNVKLRLLFEAKCREYRVAPERRVYCCNPTCSAFLGSTTDDGEDEDEDEDIICDKCGISTCPRCKEGSHLGSSCQTLVRKMDLALQELVEQERWQRCPGCHIIVSLMHGCYHMTCRCRTEFCYLCATLWKNCECPWWEEQRLVADAERRVENEMGREARRYEPRVFENLVQRRVEELAEDAGAGECHGAHEWRYRPGGGRYDVRRSSAGAVL